MFLSLACRAAGGLASGFLVLLGLSCARPAGAAPRGLCPDSMATAGLRAAPRLEAESVAGLTPGAPFTIEAEGDAEWCRVTLDSGATGWLPRAGIRLYYTERDLPATGRDPAGPSEIAQVARARGFAYAATVRRAVRGDATALKRIFALAEAVDGAAAESYAGLPSAICHLLGDEGLARFVSTQPAAARVALRNTLVGDCPLRPGVEYLRRQFPASSALLFYREIVGWPSPDGRFALRKRFSDAFRFDGSRVERAEIIEVASGRVLCDLTPDDIGTGPEREGEVLWSPDSKRVACLSCDLPESPGHLFSTPRPALQRKQTAVYELTGDIFVRVDLALAEPPGRAADRDLEGAVPGHEFIEPVRWQTATRLLLRRHDYFAKKVPMTIGASTFESIEERARAYLIRVTFKPGAPATLRWEPMPGTP